MKTPLLPVLLSLALLSPACDDETAPASDDVAGLVESAPTIDAPVALAGPHVDDGMPSEGPAPAMPGAKAAFDDVLKLVQDEYVDGPLSEDVLWTAAMEGVMNRLVQLQGHRINKLMSPAELSELMIGTQGRMVGVGIMIERVADVVVVREVVADGPAQTAGLQAGDRVLGIDGDRIKDLDLAEVVQRIRGEEGTTVDLFVQRDTEEWTATITRGQVRVGSVVSASLPGDVGYLRITSFSEDTPAEVDGQLQALVAGGVRSLVLDLRACPGGLLETALQVGERFLPPGSKLVTVHPRDGGEKVHETVSDHPHRDLPLAVLIGPDTASGAEILADALRQREHVTLLGDQTLGKHTVEAIHELSGGWAIKLSVSRFESASGEMRQGVGVLPDIHIASPDGFELGPIKELDPASDPVLAAATQLVAARGG